MCRLIQCLCAFLFVGMHLPIVHPLKATLMQVYQLDEAASALIVEKFSSAPSWLIEAFIEQSIKVHITPASEQSERTLFPLDALLSAPTSHRLLCENEYVRVLESRIEPGETVAMHTHQWDNTNVILQGSRFCGVNHEGHTIEEALEIGIEQWDGDKPDSELYTYTNVGTEPYHSIVFEMKK